MMARNSKVGNYEKSRLSLRQLLSFRDGVVPIDWEECVKDKSKERGGNDAMSIIGAVIFEVSESVFEFLRVFLRRNCDVTTLNSNPSEPASQNPSSLHT